MVCRRQEPSRQVRRLSSRPGVLAGLTLTVVAVLGGCSPEESYTSEQPDLGGYSDFVEVTDQDPDCHRRSLADAADANGGFEWNGAGMTSYEESYDACLEDLFTALTDEPMDDRDLRGRVLDGADLVGVSLVSADLYGASFFETNLRNSSLNFASFETAYLVDADLRGSAVMAVSFEGADLTGANLQGLELRTAKFKDATLVGANLEGTDLSLVDFEAADLSGANLAGSNLSWADLSLSNMDGADLTGVFWNPEGGDSPGFPPGLAPVENAWNAELHGADG